MKPTALFSLLVVLVLALGACDGGDQPDAAAKPKAATATEAPAKADPVVVVPELPAVPEFGVEPRGVINDVKVESCDTATGPVTASGTATNSGKFTRDLVVVVNWADPSTTAVVARAVATAEDVAPGESADWTADAEVPEGVESVSCVPTALAGQLT